MEIDCFSFIILSKFWSVLQGLWLCLLPSLSCCCMYLPLFLLSSFHLDNTTEFLEWNLLKQKSVTLCPNYFLYQPKCQPSRAASFNAHTHVFSFILFSCRPTTLHNCAYRESKGHSRESLKINIKLSIKILKIFITISKWWHYFQVLNFLLLIMYDLGN